MIKSLFLCFLFLAPVFCKSQVKQKNIISYRELHQENDSLVWQTATTFCNLFNKADSEGMKRFLPEDFLLQWMHENFIGKKNLINSIRDSAVHRTMEYTIVHDNSAMIRYSDDQTAVSMNARFVFIDPVEMRSIEKEHGYGLCIFYMKKENGKWVLKTIHLDIHCSLCNF